MAASEIKQKGDSVSVGNEENSTTNVDKEDDVEYTAAKKLLNEILHGLNMPESGLFLKAVLQKYPRLVNFERKTDGTCDGTVLQSVCSHFYGPYSDEELLGIYVCSNGFHLSNFFLHYHIWSWSCNAHCSKCRLCFCSNNVQQKLT